ncbi:MAG TPA: type II secretion system protein GspL [Burkholderiales bacterium]|nr:type II secretion system protein GspL [Burkholderiales bacterium]
MSLLRIYAPLGDAPLRCEWALIDERQSVRGEGRLADLPRGADRVQLVIPAAQVLITRANLPQGARRRAGSVLAFAVEEVTAAEPDANQVSWLGEVSEKAGSKAGNADALAVVDKQGLKRWRDALEAVGLRAYEVHSEILLLPRSSGEWSLAWHGGEGFVRTGEFEGAATDGGDHASPPLSLRMMLEEARLRGARPDAIAVYVTASGAAPDLKLWEAALGVPMRLLGAWDWRTAPQQAGISLAQERRRWRIAPAALASLRPAAWIAGAALAIHGAALIGDWMLLGSEQRAVRGQMEARFRSVFPDAVAVADPALQMRRQLAAARHRAGLPDGGDFAPMIEKVAIGLKGLPPGGLRTVSYESGRMTLEFAAIEETALRRTVARLIQTGLIVDVTGQKVITVRAL